MTYSKTWNENSPLGSDFVSGADEQIRDLKVAVRERFFSLIGKAVDMNSDPLVPAGYGINDPKRYFPFAPSFRVKPASVYIGVDGSVEDQGANAVGSYSFFLDVRGQSTLTGIKFWGTRATNAEGMNFQLFSEAYGTGIYSAETGIVNIPSGVQMPFTYSVNIDIVPNRLWVLSFNYSNAPAPSGYNTMMAIEFVYA